MRIGFEPWGCIWTPVRQGQAVVVATCNGDLAARTCGVPDAQEANEAQTIVRLSMVKEKYKYV